MLDILPDGIAIGTVNEHTLDGRIVDQLGFLAHIGILEFFYKERIESLSSELLASMDKAAFSKRAFAWRGRKTVERNIEILNHMEDLCLK